MSAVVSADVVRSCVSHNGRWTIRSKRTGDWRTVRVSTQPADSEFMPGKRLVSLLTGSDNESDYRSIGVLSDNGSRVFLWRKHQGSDVMGFLARVVVAPESFGHLVDVMFEGVCRKCNRPLTTPESIESGVGPVCGGRV
jgi:hypothetical protein